MKCFRCGKNHLASQCSLNREVRYRGCGGQGHLKVVCFKTREQTNQLEEILLAEHQDQRDKFYNTLKVNGRDIRFEVDSGSAVTIMNRVQAREAFPRLVLNPTKLSLVA